MVASNETETLLDNLVRLLDRTTGIKCIYRSTALCIGQLREMGVTAVLNAAQGSMADWSYVNTKAIYYTGVGIQFLGVPAIDLKWYPICNHFQEASNFIDEVIQSKGEYI